MTSVEKSFLLLHECEVIKPENFDLENHKFFKKIFTWNDSLIDNKNISRLIFQIIHFKTLCI